MNIVKFDRQEAEEGKVLAIFGYIIFLIPLLGARDNKFAQFHANQGLVLFLTSIALSIVTTVIGYIIPIIGVLVSGIGSLGILALAIIGILNVINLEVKPLPLIGEITLIKSY